MSDVRRFVKMIERAPLADTVILLVTFGLTVFADLVVAVNIGVILATLHFLRRMASSVEVHRTGETELRQELAQQGITTLPKDLVVYSVDGPFFFGAVENFERALHETQTDSGTVIIRLRWVPFIDITGLQALEEAIVELHKRGVRVMLTGANARVEGKLKKAGILSLIGSENFYQTFAKAMQACLRRESPDAPAAG
jgi:SulP family sulfate permease